MIDYEFKKGDEVTINATVWEAFKHNEKLFLKTKSGDILIVRKSDINTIHPYDEPLKEDKRRGN